MLGFRFLFSNFGFPILVFRFRFSDFGSDFSSDFGVLTLLPILFHYLSYSMPVFSANLFGLFFWIYSWITLMILYQCAKFYSTICVHFGQNRYQSTTYTPLTAAIQPKFWAQDLKITLKPPKKIADLIPSVFRVPPRSPILPPLDKKNLPKTGFEPRTPGSQAYHSPTELWSQACIK